MRPPRTTDARRQVTGEDAHHLSESVSRKSMWRELLRQLEVFARLGDGAGLLQRLRQRVVRIGVVVGESHRFAELRDRAGRSPSFSF